MEGAEKTKEMRAVWGRAAYFGEKSIGLLDGGSVVGRLVFEAISEWVDSNLQANSETGFQEEGRFHYLMLTEQWPIFSWVGESPADT